MDLNWLHPEPLRFNKNVSINLTGVLPYEALPIVQMKHQVSQKTNIHLKIRKASITAKEEPSYSGAMLKYFKQNHKHLLQQYHAQAS